uniref:tetrahydrocannabinolic acid synthase-like n=1 Tax=Erigeron canadensis TaxID=72917 RepID=UPI001CB8E703|nr:tetrahydrocannabinolic acid synthase-like [Erigeron canadensis]
MRNFQLTSFLFFLVFLTLSFSVSWGALSSILNVTPDGGDFISCVESTSDNFTAMSRLIYTPVNSSFLPLWEARVMILRFNKSSTPKPSIIVTPEDETQVRTILLCSKRYGYELRVRCGGHDFEGLSYTADVPFVMLDLNRMRSVDVDVGNRTAWVQGGAVLGELYYAISNKTNSLYFPAGLCSTVGVGGFLGGGGYGNLIRKYGTGADNVIDVRFMNVNGVILNRKSMGEDLFWAIRGGGASSFGIVLAWKLSLVSVPELVTVFFVTKTIEEGATEILHKYQYVVPSGDRDLSMRVTINSAFIGNSTSQTIKFMFQGLYLGKIDKLLSLMNKTLPELNLTREDCEEVTMAQSSIVFNGVPSDTPLEFLKSRVTSVPLNTKSKLDYVRTAIPKHGLRKIWTKMFETDVGAATLILHTFGGRNDEISETAIPYPHRAGVLYQFHQFVNFSDQASDTTPASLRRINWLRSFNDLIAPYVSRNPREAYSNYNDLDLGFEAGSYEQASVWGERYWKRHNFKKLISIKAITDPENFFRHPQSIPVFPTYLLEKRQWSSVKEPYSSL